ncbi:MAG: hypothetical protein EOO44_01090 [Flavobacterium sp.]|nr:MAG: hypothetical protein EOO44_01090 [Flavobacterium sp.]
MSGKSFYELDYLIEINEKRSEQYLSAYQKVLERFTNIILVYSAFTIFLVQIIQDVFLSTRQDLVFYICFGLFTLLFIISLVFTIRLIYPVEVAYLDKPEKYYKSIRLQYEQGIADPNNIVQSDINELIKASYILELEESVNTNNKVFKEKSSYFYNALIFGLLAALPYLVCLGYHLSKKPDTIQKVEIVKNKLTEEFMKKQAKSNPQAPLTTTFTDLPGLGNKKVIVSSPQLIKENSAQERSKPHNKEE